MLDNTAHFNFPANSTGMQLNLFCHRLEKCSQKSHRHKNEVAVLA